MKGEHKPNCTAFQFRKKEKPVRCVLFTQPIKNVFNLNISDPKATQSALGHRQLNGTHTPTKPPRQRQLHITAHSIRQQTPPALTIYQNIYSAYSNAPSRQGIKKRATQGKRTCATLQTKWAPPHLNTLQRYNFFPTRQSKSTIIFPQQAPLHYT